MEYSDEELKLLNSLAERSMPAEIEAHEALSMILGEMVVSDKDSGDEFVHTAKDKVLDARNDLEVAREMGDTQQIKDKEHQFERANELFDESKKITEAFYKEISEILNERKSNNHMLMITRKLAEEPLPKTLRL